jgi:SAM-dependent methyltransferase
MLIVSAAGVLPFPGLVDDRRHRVSCSLMCPDDLRAAYDRVAVRYAEKFADELAHKPIDRGLLDAFAALVAGRERGGGRVLELGCGPGQVAAYLAERGVDVEGIDLSPAMIEEARARFPRLRFRAGDMLALEEPDASVAGIAAFYAIVHLQPDEVARAASEWSRVLAPGGWLLMSFHVGDERIHLDEFLGERVTIDFVFHDRAAVERRLTDAGLVVETRLERRGDPAVEYPSLRAYLLARRS